MKRESRTWVIAYVNRKYLHKAQTDIKKSGFKNIIINVPTVKILNKKFKGEEHFEEIPLMLNYGFFQIPSEYINNRELMDKIKSQITCIYGWVKDLGTRGNPIASCSSEDVNAVIEMGKKLTVYTGMDLTDPEKREEIRKSYEPHYDEEGNWVKGKMVNLKGYPFDNVEAQIIKFEFKKQAVKVMIHLPMANEIMIKPATISFANLFYSIYDDHIEDDNMREVYLEDLRGTKEDKNLFDKIIHKMYEQED